MELSLSAGRNPKEFEECIILVVLRWRHYLGMGCPHERISAWSAPALVLASRCCCSASQKAGTKKKLWDSDDITDDEGQRTQASEVTYLVQRGRRTCSRPGQRRTKAEEAAEQHRAGGGGRRTVAILDDSGSRLLARSADNSGCVLGPEFNAPHG